MHTNTIDMKMKLTFLEVVLIIVVTGISCDKQKIVVNMKKTYFQIISADSNNLTIWERNEDSSREVNNKDVNVYKILKLNTNENIWEKLQERDLNTEWLDKELRWDQKIRQIKKGSQSFTIRDRYSERDEKNMGLNKGGLPDHKTTRDLLKITRKGLLDPKTYKSNRENGNKGSVDLDNNESEIQQQNSANSNTLKNDDRSITWPSSTENSIFQRIRPRNRRSLIIRPGQVSSKRKVNIPPRKRLPRTRDVLNSKTLRQGRDEKNRKQRSIAMKEHHLDGGVEYQRLRTAITKRSQYSRKGWLDFSNANAKEDTQYSQEWRGVKYESTNREQNWSQELLDRFRHRRDSLGEWQLNISDNTNRKLLNSDLGGDPWRGQEKGGYKLGPYEQIGDLRTRHEKGTDLRRTFQQGGYEGRIPEKDGYQERVNERGGYLERGHVQSGHTRRRKRTWGENDARPTRAMKVVEGRSGIVYDDRSEGVNNDTPRVRCGGVHWCTCVNQTIAYCDDGGKDLRYFPNLPNSISQVYFYNNFLPVLNKATISNLTHLRLRYLNMGNNSMTGCEEGVLSELRFLETLTIEDEWMSEKEFTKCLTGLNKTPVRSLVFPELTLSNFSREIFSGLVNSSVRLLKFYGTKIEVFNQRFFSRLPELRHIRLNNCEITVTKLLKFTKIKEISLSKNRILKFPRICVHGKPVYPNIKELYLDNNYINHLSASDVSCMTELRNLSLFGNPITALYDNMFSQLSKLRWLEVTIIMNGDVTIESLSFNSSSLSYLYLSGFQEAIEWSEVDLRLFSYCPNLLKLSLFGNSLRLLTEEDFYLFLSPLKQLTYLDLSKTEIRFLPKVISTDLLKLEILYAVANTIIGWPPYFFSPLKNFRIFDVYFNAITMLNKTSFTMEQIQSMEMIVVNQNPFVCTCDLLWFINLLRSRKFMKQFDGYPHGFTCNSPPKFQNILIDKTPISAHYCALTTAMAYSVIAVILLVIACILVASVVYRYRWDLKYATYMIHFLQRRRQRLRDDNAADFGFDVYVSCSDVDFDMLYDNVITKLEKELQLRVFVSHRDGIGLKMDSIVRNIDDSRQIILFISNSFAQDHYCEFEANLAFERYLHEKSNCMVVVLLQAVNALNVSRTLYRILKQGDSISWCEDEDGRNLFWVKFKNALRNKNDIRP